MVFCDDTVWRILTQYTLESILTFYTLWRMIHRYESIGTERETDREFYSQRTKTQVTVAKAIGVDGGLAPGEYFRCRKRDAEYQTSDPFAGSGGIGVGIPNHSAFDGRLEP